jgi:hypothetical protein
MRRIFMKVTKNTMYLEEGREMGELVPMHLYTGNNCANACGYHFDTIDDIHYFVITFEELEFCFNKYYPMDRGMNQELWDMLLKARAVRFTDGKIDFNALMMYVFNFEVKLIRSANGFLIYDVDIQQDSYYANVDTFNQRDSVFEAIIEEHKYENNGY